MYVFVPLERFYIPVSPKSYFVTPPAQVGRGCGWTISSSTLRVERGEGCRPDIAVAVMQAEAVECTARLRTLLLRRVRGIHESSFPPKLRRVPFGA
jgi:hypothetical protein